MKAYAILDGGGVKGAALAGCLEAARELNIEWAGFGGTSAGSIVALLAALGYSGQDLLRLTVEDVDWSHFLDDGGDRLERLTRVARRLEQCRPWCLPAALLWSWWAEGRLWRRLRSELGLYRADRFQAFLRAKIYERFPELRGQRDVTFADLRRQGARPLKVVASDTRQSKAVVFSGAGGAEWDGPVLEAVRASVSYPFVFRPVRMFGRYLVDGALSSNLPVFLFDRERQQNGLPVVAFDLVSAPGPTTPPGYGLVDFSRDVLNTALESSDELLRQVTRGLYHVRVAIPSSVGTLDFWLTREQRLELWRCGHSQTHTFFRRLVPHWLDAQDEVGRLQALYADPLLFRQLLEVLASEVEQGTPATAVRAQIMLPTGRGTRQVVYHWGMDDDPDSDLELALDGGCSGRAWVTHRPHLADLAAARRAPLDWNLTGKQQQKVRRDRLALLCVPIFDPAHGGADPGASPLLGTLSLDSATSLAETRWPDDEFAVRRARFWADVFAQLLSRR